MRFLSFLLFILISAGTAVAAPFDARQMQAENRDGLLRILADCEKSYAVQGLDVIRQQIDLSHHLNQEPPFAGLSGDGYPTEEQRQAIRHWASLRALCVVKVAAFLDRAPVPAEMDRKTVLDGYSFYIRGMTATSDLISVLAQGSMTFGDFANRRAKLVAEIDADHLRWSQAMAWPDDDARLRQIASVRQRFDEYLAALFPQPSPVTPPMRAALDLSFPKGPDRPDDVAVIIGNGDYHRQGRDIPDVRPAHADAAAMRIYVLQALGIRERNIIMLSDATAAQMQAVFGNDHDHRGQLYDWVKPGRSRIFVYYAGHGAPVADGSGPYLVPADAEASRIALSAYPLPLLYDNLSRLPSQGVTVVLEACFSGMSQAGSLMARASPILISPKGALPPANVTVISAAGFDQIGSWEADASHGLFTEYFLKGMSGEADQKPYGNQDGKVTLEELERYLKENLSYWARRYYGREQVAQFMRSE